MAASKMLKVLFTSVITLFLITGLVGQAPAQTCIQPPAGLVSWWAGDGNADDRQGNNPGILVGTTFVSGKVGQAFSFDGIDDYIDLGANASLNWGPDSSFTYEFWLKTTENYGMLISQRLDAYQAAVLDIAVGYTGWLLHPGQIVAEIRDDTDPTWASGCVTQCTEVNSGTTVNDGNFHHVAVVRDAVERQVKIYVDGVLTNQANDKLISSITTDTRAIGSARDWVHKNWGSPDQQYFNGLIDELEIFSRALSAAEIAAIYNAGSAGKCKTVSVAIDIKPGSFPNSINLGSAGVVPVAILSSPTFDATQVDPATISLAGAKVKLIGKGDKYSCHAEDVNSDGLPDLVCQVLTAQFMIESGDSVAVLEANTFGGQAIRGEDSIKIVP